ncbi:MAG: SLATT domain-containing protein [Candidatus Taylorbacteria bacterium]|nr:SLATT domain-containing protein [Candidatus Taylorbacteria bacterium]
MREKYNRETDNIEQNCTYTAEAHHIITLRNKKMSTWFQLVPAVVAAALGAAVGGGFISAWWVWISVVSAVIAAVGNVLNPMKEYYDNLNAAKNFTALKHDARALRDVFSSRMNDEEYMTAVQILHDRYNDLLRFAPPTNKEAFEEARKRVKEGIHKPD